MAKKRYKFPAGTTEISGEEIQQALCTYEEVEIPGSVMELDIKVSPGTYEKDVVTRRLILNEGTQVFNASFPEDMPVIACNVPQSLNNIRGASYENAGFCFPKVLCLPQFFHSASGVWGVEYLQAYCTSDVKYNKFHLKHYVYLGTKVPTKNDSFTKMDEGGVIHVESKKVALSVMKKCDFMKVYVIPDALEWKDFPADKLALTMEEYDPESRMLPEQKKMREERLKALKEKEEQEQEKLRQESKRSKLKSLTDNVIKMVLAPVVGTYEEEIIGARRGPNNTLITVKATFTQPAYNIKFVEESGKEVMLLKAIVAQNLWSDSRKNMCVVIKMDVDDVMAKQADIIKFFIGLRDFLASSRETVEKYKIDLDEGRRKLCHAIELLFAFQNGYIVAQLNRDTLSEDVKPIADFVDTFSKITDEGKEAFPLGFFVERVASI